MLLCEGLMILHLQSVGCTKNLTLTVSLKSTDAWASCLQKYIFHSIKIVLVVNHSHDLQKND